MREKRKGNSIPGIEQFGPSKPKSQMHCPLSHNPFPEQSFGQLSENHKSLKLSANRKIKEKKGLNKK
jgi:hypothetical protein